MQKLADIARLPAALPLEGGGLLVEGQIAWEAYGRRDPENAIIVLHDFANSHRAVGEGFGHGWGNQFIGPDLALAPHHGWTVSFNLLGSPFGSTNPAMMLGTVLQPGLRLTVADLARGVAAGMRALGIKRARALVGVGLGGMVALRALSLFPELAAGVATLGTAMELPGKMRDQLAVVPKQVKTKGYPALREALLRWEHHPDSLKAQHGTHAAADAWLEAEAVRFCEQFDVQCFAALAVAWSGAELKRALETVRCKVLLVAGSHDELAPPRRVRETYHVLTAAGARAQVLEISEPKGHCALLDDSTRLVAPLGEFLSSL